MDAADLLGSDLLQDTGTVPVLMVGTVIDTNPTRVVVPAFDGGQHALTAFGNLPDAAPGDEVRVQVDHYGGLVIVAWEPQDA